MRWSLPMVTPRAQSRVVISFGPFNLIPSERLLTKADKPVELGARALDILLILVSRANEVIGKKELLHLAWPGVVVQEVSLRFHVASLRKVLGDGESGAQYISTLPGRGYCFTASVSRSSDLGGTSVETAAGFGSPLLPCRSIGMIGRDDDVTKLSARLKATRFVTIVGAAGIGKTRLAAAIGQQFKSDLANTAFLVDLSTVSDPKLVPAAVASMLGVSVPSGHATLGLITCLLNRRMLLILDTCEHLVEAVAALASRIFAAAPEVYILATSREALQAEGEHVYRLEPLECPPEEIEPSAAVAQTFPAIQLFVERALTSGARLDFSDTEAATVASMCRKLGGVALAIELAARRVDAYGLDQTAALLGQRVTLLWSGPRSAPPRQRTLHAAFDWSYGLLSEIERGVLRRLAALDGYFTLEAAVEVASCATLDRGEALSAIGSLVTKSMVATRPIGATMRYRLFDTTRTYALGVGTDKHKQIDLVVGQPSLPAP
jgi:predicted ATPase/DNA-binding winged helix-turn-helix (wHTH) protein